MTVSYLFVIVDFVIVTILMALISKYWQWKYYAANDEVARLQSLLDSSVVRLDRAPEAGTPIIIIGSTDYGEPVPDMKLWEAETIVDHAKADELTAMAVYRQEQEKLAEAHRRYPPVIHRMGNRVQGEPFDYSD